MTKLEKAAIQSLRNILRRKAEHAAARAHEANWSNNPTDASFYNGVASGYLCAVVELDGMLNFLEKR